MRAWEFWGEVYHGFFGWGHLWELERNTVGPHSLLQQNSPYAGMHIMLQQMRSWIRDGFASGVHCICMISICIPEGNSNGIGVFVNVDMHAACCASMGLQCKRKPEFSTFRSYPDDKISHKCQILLHIMYRNRKSWNSCRTNAKPIGLSC